MIKLSSFVNFINRGSYLFSCLSDDNFTGFYFVDLFENNQNFVLMCFGRLYPNNPSFMISKSGKGWANEIITER